MSRPLTALEPMNLNVIADEVRSCARCTLYQERHCAVPGEGSARARIMLIGEAPGAQEDLQGRPFVGRSGKILDHALQVAGLKRQDLFITSVVKCRPPHNRLPRKIEVETCMAAHLHRQISVIQPFIICILGGVSAKALLGEASLSRIRGRLIQRDRLYFPTYHPAAAGRNPAWRQIFEADLVQLRSLIDNA